MASARAETITRVCVCVCLAHPSPPSNPHHPADSITCSLLGAGLQSGPCGSLSGTFKSYASRFASADCATVRRASADLGGLPEPSDACCNQLRQFAANGCACDSVTSSLARTFLGGGDTQSAIKGGVKLAQASRCSAPAQGGPIVDTCDGSTGCPVKAL